MTPMSMPLSKFASQQAGIPFAVWEDGIFNRTSSRTHSRHRPAFFMPVKNWWTRFIFRGNLISQRNLIGLMLLAGLICQGCQGMFYYPTRKVFFTPNMFGIRHENVYFKNSQGHKLHGWHLPSRSLPARGTVLFFHGNAHNISHYLLSVIEFPLAGYHLFTFDYQGYGLSEGKPDPAGTLADADAALYYLVNRRETEPGPIVVFGQSLGGTVALNWTAIRKPEPVAAVISESAFASYRQLIRDKMNNIGILRWFREPLSRWFIDDGFDPQPVMHLIAPVPVLIVHGTQDPVVPYVHGKQLFQAAVEPKEFWSITNGGHISMLGRNRDRYWERLLNYLERILAPEYPSPLQWAKSLQVY